MDVTGRSTAVTGCRGVSEILNRVGDKWTVQVVVALRGHPRRFNDLKRQIIGVSQQMLTRTLKTLERDGFASRTVINRSPPQVEYALTDLGRSLAEPLRMLAEWSIANLDIIHRCREQYDKDQ